jgi:hypothetical protein
MINKYMPVHFSSSLPNLSTELFLVMVLSVSPETLDIDVTARPHRMAPWTDSPYDEFLRRSARVENLCGRVGKGCRDISDEIGSVEHRELRLPWEKTALVGLPELDLENLLVWIFLEARPKPAVTVS